MRKAYTGILGLIVSFIVIVGMSYNNTPNECIYNIEKIIYVFVGIIIVIVSIYFIVKQKKLKAFNKKKLILQYKKNYIYFDQCLLHLKNGSIGQFESIYGLITNKTLKSNLFYLLLGMRLKTTKKSEQNKVIKLVKELNY